MERIKTYREFWPFYLREHRHPKNRRLHVVGLITAAVLLFLLVATENVQWLWVCPLIGYASAWYGHFFIEKNRPATFKYPVWSFISDIRMTYCWLTGKINSEMAKAYGKNNRG